MGDSKTSFFALDIILLFVFVNLIYMIFNLTRLRFVAILFIVLILLFLSFIALIGVYKHNNWGFVLLSLIFAAILAGIVVVRYMGVSFTKRMILTMLLTALGFIISIAGIKRKEAFEEPEIETSFEPGKYIASSTGSTYHAPTCDWAKKIKESNRVWFDSDKDAKKEGYKKHSCLK